MKDVEGSKEIEYVLPSVWNQSGKYVLFFVELPLLLHLESHTEMAGVEADKESFHWMDGDAFFEYLIEKKDEMVVPKAHLTKDSSPSLRFRPRKNVNELNGMVDMSRSKKGSNEPLILDEENDTFSVTLFRFFISTLTVPSVIDLITSLQFLRPRNLFRSSSPSPLPSPSPMEEPVTPSPSSLSQ